MNIFITTGTYSFLEKIKFRHPSECIVLMQSTEDSSSLLMHETTGDTIFQQPRKYEVLDHAGDIDQVGFISLNHIPVTDEGRPLFEFRFQDRSQLINKEPGFLAYRLLRPLSNDTYIMMTVWKKELDYRKWKNSLSYAKTFEDIIAAEKKAYKNIFSGPSYLSTYIIPDEDEEKTSK